MDDLCDQAEGINISPSEHDGLEVNKQNPSPTSCTTYDQQKKPVGGNSKPNITHVPQFKKIILLKDVKLHETENPWKSTGMMRGYAHYYNKDEELFKSVRVILNKLTPQKFDTLVGQIQNLPIHNSDQLQGISNLIFEKAIDEPLFVTSYAQVCRVLFGMQVPAERRTPEDPEYINFRKLIVNRCQAAFEANNEAILLKDVKLKEINLQTDAEKKKELMLVYEEEEKKIRMKSVGIIRFLGELYKLQMLSTSIMHICISQLLTSGDGESLECLCKLLTSIGKDLESKAAASNKDLGEYFNRMQDIANKRGSVSSRVRFMLQDVIELRQNKWIPRRDDANPKTMDQIKKDADKKTMDRKQWRWKDDRDRRDVGNQWRKQNQRGDSNQPSDGRNNVPARTNHNRAIDSLILNMNKVDIDNLNLGSSNQISKWSRSAGRASKGEKKKPTQGYSNLYNVLQDSATSGDEKRDFIPSSVLIPKPKK